MIKKYNDFGVFSEGKLLEETISKGKYNTIELFVRYYGNYEDDKTMELGLERERSLKKILYEIWLKYEAAGYKILPVKLKND